MFFIVRSMSFFMSKIIKIYYYKNYKKNFIKYMDNMIGKVCGLILLRWWKENDMIGILAVEKYA